MQRALVIDDERMVLSMLERQLPAKGFSVDLADNGVEGLLRFIDHDCAFVLLDIAMPRLNGTDTLRIMKRLKPAIPIVTITGHVGQGQMAETVRLGAVACLPKPFVMDEVLRLVAEPGWAKTA
ncbi:MAG: response regulator [Actinobacteria bacterium]|nr:response regulator [Actinomycetota bacterium]